MQRSKFLLIAAIWLTGIGEFRIDELINTGKDVRNKGVYPCPDARWDIF